MSKHHHAAGLDQLGPRHWGATAPKWKSRSARSISERVKQSASRRRKPKVTLPKVKLP